MLTLAPGRLQPPLYRTQKFERQTDGKIHLLAIIRILMFAAQGMTNQKSLTLAFWHLKSSGVLKRTNNFENWISFRFQVKSYTITYSIGSLTKSYPQSVFLRIPKTTEKVQKSSSINCNIPLSEPFRND